MVDVPALVDGQAIVKALEELIAAQSAALKNAIVLLQQFDAKVTTQEATIASLQAQVAADQASLTAAAALNASLEADTKSITDAIAQYSASGQLSV